MVLETGTDANNMDKDDFASLLAATELKRSSLQPGQKVKGKVIAITRDSIFVDLGIKQDGILDHAEFLDSEGKDTVREGDEVEAWIVSISPLGPRLSKSMTGSGVAALEDARDAGIPVEGRIIGPCKGGYQVEVLGKTAFCPGSQMQNLPGVSAEEMAGRLMQFLITKVEHNGRNIVVSRRALLEREKQENIDKLLAEIKIGDITEGIVTRLPGYGAFIELAPGIEGLAHISELSFGRVEKPEDVLATGEKVKVKIISMEKDAKGNLRFGLSLKQAMADPWENILDQIAPGDLRIAKVTRLAPFGAFMEIAPGVEGLAHISEFSWEKRINKPEEMLAVGDNVNVKIKDIAPDAKRISLSIKDAQGDPWSEVEEKFKAGAIAQGIVESATPKGLVVALAPGITGFLPAGNARHANIPLTKMKQGDEIQAAILSVDASARRIILEAPDPQQESEKNWRQHAAKEDNGKGFGIMAQALQKAMQKKH